MGKITGLWLTAMMVLAVVAVSTPMVGPGVAAASNHGTETVEGPDIQVADAGLIDTRADTGQNPTPQPQLWVTFENTGDAAGDVPITVAVGGREVTVIGTDEVTVEAGDTRNVTTTYVLETGDGGYIDDGEHEVTVNGEPAGTLVVGEPNITITDHSWNTTTVSEGGAVELTVTAENTGAVAGQRDIVTSVDGQSAGGVSFDLGPGESGTDTYVYTFEESGEYEFGTAEETQTITVEAQDGGGAGPPDVQVQDAGLIDTRVDTAQMQTPQPQLWVAFENTGGAAETVPITVAVGGRDVTVTDTDEVTVEAGATRNVTTTYVLETGDGGYIDDGEHEVTVNGESAGTLVVGQPTIQVTEAEWNTTTVAEGGAVELSVTAENTGIVSGQREIFVSVAGDSVSAVSFDLGPGESGTDTYVHTFEETGEFAFSVGGETETITVEQPASFEVSDRALSSRAVGEGDSIEVTATVTNTGDRAGTYEVPLTVSDEEVDTTEVELGPDESTTVSFTQSFNAVGNYAIGLDGERIGTVQVSEPATFETTTVEINRTAVATGEPIAVTATVRNEGDDEGTADVRLQEDGNTIDTQSVTLSGGESTTVTFVQSFSEAGTRDIAVDNQFGASVTVTEPATFDITNAQVGSETVTEGGAVEISATVTNTGDREGTYQAEFAVANSVVETQAVTLAGGESTEITYGHTFNASGNYAVAVAGERAGTVTVKEPATFDTGSIELNRTAARAGDALEVTATVVNNGDQEGESQVRLQANDEIVNTTNVTLSGGEQTEVTFVHVFESGGEYDMSVNGNAGGTVMVTQPATFEVESAQLSSASVDEGDSTDVTATIANVGTENGTYQAELLADGQVVKERTVGPIAGGQTETVTFSISFDDAGDRSLTVGNVTAGTLSVEAESSGGGGGGGGGFNSNDADESDETDDAGGGAAPPAISQSEISNGVTVRVTADAANSTVSQSLNRSGPSETAPAFTLAGLSLNVTNESNGFNTTMLGPHATSNDMAAVPEDGVRGYVTVTSGANASDISRATYTLRLNESSLPANGSMDAVRVYQYHNGTWNQLPSTVTTTNDSIRATSPRLSTIAVVSPMAVESTLTATATPSTAPTAVSVTDASLTADWVRAGFNTSARATVENPTDEAVEQTLTVTVDGSPVASRTVQLDAGEQTTVAMEFEAVEGSVAVNGVSAGDLRVGSVSNQATGENGADETGESGGGAQAAEDTVAASGPGFTVQLVAIVLALVAGVVRLRRRV
ncbi:cell surface glycoprotein [Haloarcula sp. S1AR25-5A]|uniref:Cell surface glycoprotein n=1 Tax=Haloarcula terrestris TaxID=2950533 RepID=A0AAE4EZF3_9EURY|nr:CARDB domain-containing protein [Haloarcula terrestris]MDS0221608.1 cell surface glycoprotein [Haloarcula terrestris]